MDNIIIIGAGVSGLSVSYHLRKQHTVFETEKHPGGLCKSVRIGGCTFDYSGHFIHFHHPETTKLINGKLLRGNISTINRKAWAHTHGAYIPYPFQANLYALPADIRKECVDGVLKRPRKKLSGKKNFYEWSVETFGAGITKYFMKPYNEKLWTVPARTLTTEWSLPFVPRPSRKEILMSAAGPAEASRNLGYNASFSYPESGGIQALIDSLSEKTADLRTGTKITKVNLKNKYVEDSEGEIHYYDTLVSSAPLDELIKMASGVPPEISAAAKKLRCNSVYCLNIAFSEKYAGPGLAGKHWVYFPEKRFNFYRAGVYSNISQGMAPQGMSSMYIEISAPGGRRLGKNSAFEDVKQGLVAAGILAPGPKIEIVEWLDMPHAYVIYDRNRADAVKTIQEFLIKNNVRSIGRYGAWKYSFMEESIWEGMQLARELNDKAD